MSAISYDHISMLMGRVREVVLGIQEEQEELKENLRKFSLPLPLPHPPQPHPRTRKPRQLSSSSSSNTPTVPTASPTDEPSAATTLSSDTLSSATATTGSTRPPPYNSCRTMSATTAATKVAQRGALIVLEGLDRVGKSTLAKKLVEHLERARKPVSYCRFPDRTTPIGNLINDFLKSSNKRIDDHAMHLLFSANRWELNKSIRNTLKRGTTVIVDRYSYSGIAYSSAKQGLTMEWCRETEKGLPRPDLVIYLELPKEEQYKRQGFGDERFENEELQELIRYQYQHLMDMSPELWLKVDVESKSPDQVLGEIIVPVKNCLEACAQKELGSLEFL